jgi:polyhydroxybutyrate depolymerase
VTLNVPAGFDDATSYPLIVVLHGYSVDGIIQEAYFGVRAEVDAGRAFSLAPDGLTDSLGHPYWNADPACCDVDHTNPDDSGYLSALIADVTTAWPVSDVFVVGHSNGGYMAYRMACDHADQISAIGVLAGIVSTDPAACQPSQPVSVLHMHGTLDTEVPYDQTSDYAGAMGSVTRWAGYDGCDATPAPGATADFDSDVAGDETQISTFSCPSGLGVELWTLTGSTHIPVPTPAYEPALVGWLEDHAR